MTSPFSKAIQVYRRGRETDVGGSPHARGKARQFGIHPAAPCFLEPFFDGVALGQGDPDTKLYSAESLFHEFGLTDDGTETLGEVQTVLPFHVPLTRFNLQNFNTVIFDVIVEADAELIPLFPVSVAYSVDITWQAIQTNILDFALPEFYQDLTWNTRDLLTLDEEAEKGTFVLSNETQVLNADEDLGAPVIDPLIFTSQSILAAPMWGTTLFENGPYYGLLLKVEVLAFPEETELSAVTITIRARVGPPLKSTGLDRGFVGNLDTDGITDRQIINEAR